MQKKLSTKVMAAVAGLNARTQLLAFEAAQRLFATADSDFEDALISVLREGRRPFNRAAAAFVMQVVTTSKVVSALERCLSDRDESPRVRGEAAEALAHNHRKQSHDVLLRNLMDENKEVRFWCAFALGEMAEPRAIPALSALAASDTRMIRGFHTVSREAQDAIRKMKSRDKVHRRKPGCMFCR